MTTRHSPIQRLRDQAARMAIEVKSRATRKQAGPIARIAIAMDDGIRIYERSWDALKELTTQNIEDEIVDVMREEPKVKL